MEMAHRGHVVFGVGDGDALRVVAGGSASKADILLARGVVIPLKPEKAPQPMNAISEVDIIVRAPVLGV